VIFHEDLEDPVYGFIIRNRHGINLYGTNTKVQGIKPGLIRRDERVETTFSFNCWLAPDLYSVSIAVHSPNSVSFDWMDGALYFRVFSAMPIEGVANLNARATTGSLGANADANVAISQTR
jgi:lipopolysaccharide transport system ATP-binding protein